MEYFVKKQNEIPPIIQIEEIPSDLSVGKLNIEPNKCFVNSYRVANFKNSQVKIIEGVLLLKNENSGLAMPHVWNKYNNIYFDITKRDVWEGDESFDEDSELIYMPICSFSPSEFVNGQVFEFDDLTKVNVDSINEYIKKDKSE